MEYDEKLEDILEKIGYSENNSDISIFHHSCYDWVHYVPWSYFMPESMKLSLHDFKSRQRRKEIALAAEELVLNSLSACVGPAPLYEDRKDLFVNLRIYYGTKGAALEVIDDGPGFDHVSELEKRRMNQKWMTNPLYHHMDDDYPGGTGIYCLLNFAQDFQYNKKGNMVVARFDLTKARK